VAIMALISLISSLVPLLPLQAQNPESANAVKPLSQELKNQLIALRDAALKDQYVYEQTAHLTDNIGPRPVGSMQAQAAVQYVAGELRRLGLEVQLEEIAVPHWIRGAETAELVDYPGRIPETTQKIVLTALGGTVPTPAAGITAELMVAQSFDDLTTLGREKVAGKILLFNVLFDEKKAANGLALEAYDEAVAYRSRGPRLAAQFGAAACLIRSVAGADYRLPHTGFSTPAGIPAGAVTSEDADLIARLAAQGKVRMHLTLTSETGPDTPSYNVIGDLKGSEHPEQVVIVSGHLDSWDLGTGAIDDAAGVAVAMEAAYLIRQLGLHPRRTIRVIAWMDEENGGRGRAAYSKEHSAEFADHFAAMESDLGAGHPLGFVAKINPEALPVLKPIQEILQSFGANLIRLTIRNPGADIAPLAQAGIPAFGIMQDARTYFDYHHSAADTLDKIVPQELRENAAAMVVMGYALANLQTLPR